MSYPMSDEALDHFKEVLKFCHDEMGDEPSEAWLFRASELLAFITIALRDPKAHDLAGAIGDHVESIIDKYHLD